ncbi:ATP-binding cassette domain-containing protein [Saccharothrix sp. AJ9571]|nr:ATP-binding cassette domain-containing protein [Saccharothrix sp. AJ9571]
MSDIAIRTEGLTKRFGPVQALDGVDIEVPRGTVLGLLGHNGAGKTTLVNILSTVSPQTSGTAEVGGFDVRKQAGQVRKRIGLTGQFAALDGELPGFDNLVFIARLLGASRKQAKLRATELIEAFALTASAGRPARTYSGGMRRRLDLAVGMVARPAVLFLDEPTTGLDPESRIGLWELVEQLVDEGTTVLLTTQYLDEADRLADLITVLGAGRVIASGTAEELKAEVGSRSIRITLAGHSDALLVVAALSQAGFQPSTDELPQTVTVPAGSSTDLAAVIRAIDGVGVEFGALSLAEPTLDDVYLSLTRKK